MGITEKLKRLHKQTLMKLKDIKRVVIADEAGVNNEEYLNRARTLDSYINPDGANQQEKQTYSEPEAKTAQKSQAKASTKKTTKFKM